MPYSLLDRHLFRAVIDNIPDLIFVKNTEGRFQLANPAAVKLLGAASVEEVKGKTDADFFPQTLADKFRADDQEVMRTGQVQIDREETFVDPSGAPGWLETTKVPLRDDQGEIVGVVGISRDITRRKEAERANGSKSEFLSRMSHELRTPLNAILGFAQLLEMGSMSARQHDSVTQILKGGRHLLTLINEVLDIARIEAGQLALSLEPVLVDEVLQEAKDLVAPLAASHRVSLTELSQAVARGYIQADRQRFKQILLNLLANAIKYNREGGRVTITCRELSGNDLRIEITDTGRGIPKSKMDLLFKPFERMGAEGTGIEGSGVGLALSKKLVDAMHGKIGAASELGEGSVFWLEFPLAEGQLEVCRRSLEPGFSAATQYEKHKTVLHIEDNLASSQLMESILEARPSVKLVSAMQGQIGLDWAQEHRPDLILLDVHLPDMKGDEVLRRLRASPSTKTIPVAITSADATQRQIDRLMAAGADAYLTKPLDIRRLLEFLDSQLNDEAPTAYAHRTSD